MSDSARKKFNFRVAPSNRQLWAMRGSSTMGGIEVWMGMIARGIAQNDPEATSEYEKNMVL